MKENVDNIEYASLLYDFYGSLLDEKASRVMEFYHEYNLSLSEIAEELKMSRQGVHYLLKKAENDLETFEAKLGLIAGQGKLNKAEDIAKKIKEEIRTYSNGDYSFIIERLDDLIDLLSEIAE